MNIFQQSRIQSKIDSRRFSKGVYCEILAGDYIDVLKTNNLIPPSVDLSKENGLDSKLLKLVAIPLPKYEELEKLSKLLNAQVANDLQDEQAAQAKRIKEDRPGFDVGDVDTLTIISAANDRLINFIKQNMILVQLNDNMPEGKRAGLDPKFYAVEVDSIDVSQSASGFYVRKTIVNIRETDTRWDKK